MTGDVVSHGLGVQENHPYFTRWQASEVDDSNAATLACAGTGPTNLATATTLANDGSSLRISGEPREELQPLVLGPQFVRLGDERGRLRERVHRHTIRQRRICRNLWELGGANVSVQRRSEERRVGKECRSRW